MTTIGRLNYKIVADTAGFTKSILATRSELALAKRLMEDTKPTLSRHQEAVDRLTKLYLNDAISLEAYNKGMDQLKAELPENVAAQRQLANEMERARQITTAMISPTEKYAEQMRELDDLLKKGRISQETYARAAKDYRDKLDRQTVVTAELVKEKGALTKADAEQLPVVGNLIRTFTNLHPVVLGVTAAFAGVTAAMGVATAAFRVASRAVSEQLEALDRTAKDARKLGVATDEFIRLRYAVGQIAGLSAEQFSGAMSKMQKMVIEAAAGVGKARVAFDLLGVSAADLAAMSPDQALLAISDAVREVQSPVEQLRIAYKLFGDDQAAMIMVLRAGREEIKALGEQADKLRITISQVDALQIEAANDAVQDMKLAFEGLAVVLTTHVAPIVATVARDITGVMTDPGQAAQDASQSLLTLSNGFRLLRGDVMGILHSGYDSYWNHVTVATAEASNSLEAYQAAMDKQANQVRQLEAEKQALEERQRQLEKLRHEADAIRAANLTPQEQHAKGLAKATALYRQGVLAHEFYVREVQRLDAELRETQRRAYEDSPLGKAEKKRAEEAKKFAEDVRAAHKKVMDEGRALAERYKSPIEKLRDRMADLARLYRVGAIDAATFQRAQRAEIENTRKQVEVKRQLLGANDAVLKGSAQAAAMESQRIRAGFTGNPGLRDRIAAEARGAAGRALAGAAPTTGDAREDRITRLLEQIARNTGASPTPVTEVTM